MAPFIPSVPIPTPLLPPPFPSKPKRLSGICQVVWSHDGAFVIKGLPGGGDVLALIVLKSWPNTSQTAPPPPLHGLFSVTPLYKIFCNVSARSRFKSASVSRSKDSVAQSVNAEWSSMREVPNLIASIPCFGVFPFRLVLSSLKYR